MAYENLCMYCFQDTGGESICPHCGHDSRAAVPQIQLMPGSRLYNERFLVGRALGQTASGIVYAAFDTKRENRLRIHEYLPRDSARRLNDGSVVPVAGQESAFEQGLTKLRASVEGVEDPAKRHFFFEENGTGYVVQRKNAAAESEEEENGGRSTKQIAIIIGAAVVVVLVAAFVLISILNNVLDNTDYNVDSTPNPDQVWQPDVTPSPTPYVSPTISAGTKLELTWMNDTTVSGKMEEFKASQTEVKDDGTNLNKTKIKHIQELLIQLGYLKSGSADGVYGKNTSQAVKSFQEWVNSQVGSGTLRTDGNCDDTTLQYMEYAVEQGFQPNATPTPTPSAGEVGKIESLQIFANGQEYTGSVLKVSGEKVVLAWSAAGSVEGYYVYVSDSHGTVIAQGENVTYTSGSFEAQQIEPNTVYSIRVSAMPVNGKEADMVTKTAQFMLEASATPSPSPSPTPNEGGAVINKDSDKAAIQAVQRMLIQIGLLPQGSDDGVYGNATINAVKEFQTWANTRYNAGLTVSGECDARTLGYLEQAADEEAWLGEATPSPTPEIGTVSAPQITIDNAQMDENNVAYVTGDSVTFRWSSTGDLASYYMYMTNSKGEKREWGESTETSIKVDASIFAKDGPFTIFVGAIPTGGTRDNAAWSNMTFVLGAIPTAEPDPTPTPPPAPLPELRAGEYYAAVQLGDASSMLNLRQAPTTQSQVVAQLANGRRLIVCSTADGDGWVQVRTAEYEGYCKLEYLKAE